MILFYCTSSVVIVACETKEKRRHFNFRVRRSSSRARSVTELVHVKRNGYEARGTNFVDNNSLSVTNGRTYNFLYCFRRSSEITIPIRALRTTGVWFVKNSYGVVLVRVTQARQTREVSTEPKISNRMLCGPHVKIY